MYTFLFYLFSKLFNIHRVKIVNKRVVVPMCIAAPIIGYMGSRSHNVNSETAHAQQTNSLHGTQQSTDNAHTVTRIPTRVNVTGVTRVTVRTVVGAL